MPSAQAPGVNPLGLLFAGVVCILLIILPRRHALLPFVLTTCYMTYGQVFLIGGMHFTILRLLVIVGCARIAIRTEYKTFNARQIDWIVILWVACSTVAFILLRQNSDAVVNRLGFAYNTLGLYFLFRCLIRTAADIRRVFKQFAVLMFPLAIIMLIEKQTGVNPFYAFGGVAQVAEIRNGVIRCQGPFQHPILAGTFGAMWVALFTSLWAQGKHGRLIAVIGLLSSTVITFLAGSSGPVLSYAACLLAVSARVLERSMRFVRWAIGGSLVILALTMRAPIWFVFARVNILSGSTGWHRANLIDRTIANFSDWWLFGTDNVAKWGVWAGDITNQYIWEGVNGGLLSALLFIGIIVVGFKSIGITLRVLRNQRPATETYRLGVLTWALGATLFAHVITFFSISYFDQNIVNWFLLLAIIPACRQEASVAALRGQETGRMPILQGGGGQAEVARRKCSPLLLRDVNIRRV